MTEGRSIRAFIFDFDGTLVESNDIKRSAFFEVTAGIAGAADILRRLLAKPDVGDRYDIFRGLESELGADRADARRLTDAYGAFCEREILALLETSRVMPSLDGLKGKGYALFIASATPQECLIAILQKTPFARLFDEVGGRPRSKTAILRDICRRHGWSPLEVVMVGDSALDSQAAVEIGCRFIGVGGNAERYAGAAEFLVDDVDSLAQPALYDRIAGAAG